MYESYKADHGSIPEYPTPSINLIKRDPKDKKKKKKVGKRSSSPKKAKKKK